MRIDKNELRQLYIRIPLCLREIVNNTRVVSLSNKWLEGVAVNVRHCSVIWRVRVIQRLGECQRSKTWDKIERICSQLNVLTIFSIKYFIYYYRYTRWLNIICFIQLNIGMTKYLKITPLWTTNNISKQLNTHTHYNQNIKYYTIKILNIIIKILNIIRLKY